MEIHTRTVGKLIIEGYNMPLLNFKKEAHMESVTGLVRDSRNYLSPGQIVELKGRIRSNEQWLETHKLSEIGRVRYADESRARAEIADAKKLLAKRTAPEGLSKQEREKLLSPVGW